MRCWIISRVFTRKKGIPAYSGALRSRLRRSSSSRECASDGRNLHSGSGETADPGNKQIDRINELYHKSQSVGLTDEEKEEQAALRKQYVADIKASLRGHLNNISIVEKDGSVTDLGKKYGNVGNTES